LTFINSIVVVPVRGSVDLVISGTFKSSAIQVSRTVSMACELPMVPAGMAWVTRAPLAIMPFIERAARVSRFTFASVCAAGRLPAPMVCMRFVLVACDWLGNLAGRLDAVLFVASNSWTTPATGSEMVTLVSVCPSGPFLVVSLRTRPRLSR
jgi:hypothetical protein